MIDGYETKPFLSREDIQGIVTHLAFKMIKAYSGCIARGENLVVLVILNGAMQFAVDVLRMAKLPVRVETVKATSYRGTLRGEVGIIDLITRHIDETDHVLIIEDIVDTGRTLVSILDQVGARYNPQSVKVMTLIDKPTAHEVPVVPDFIGCEAQLNEFVIGYGMDLDGRYRWMDEIVKLVKK